MLKDDVDYLFNFIDDLPIGIICLDTTTDQVSLINKFMLEMVGWDESEINTLEKWFHTVYPDDEYRASIIKLWSDMIEETESQNKPYSSIIEVKVAVKDGSVRWCNARYYRKGNFVYGIFVDISYRQNAENKLKEISLTDPLTEIHNRRYFNLEYDNMWHLAQRTKTPISIIICDIDDLKNINDTYGHIKGDQVIITAAKTISSTLKRSTDFVARYGGDEFVVVSYDCKEESAFGLCKMIKNNIDNTPISDMGDDSYSCTMSFGVNTIVPNSNITPEQFFNNADKAMYEAKKTGENRIVVSKL
ncbi:MAG: diguanylate cyclase [Sulfurovum sp.]|nr:diguanylate cyclase [Sulfurovum sp.]